MTPEELKAEANKLGYNIIKKKSYVRFRVCDCGCNRRSLSYHFNNCRIEDIKTGKVIYKEDFVSFTCLRCGVRAYGSTEAEAKRNWNDKKYMSTEVKHLYW